MNEALKIEREKTKQVMIHELSGLMSNQLMQLLTVYAVVEYLQKYHGFGDWEGTAVQGAAITRAVDLKATAETFSEGLEPVVKLLAQLLPTVVSKV